MFLPDIARIITSLPRDILHLKKKSKPIVRTSNSYDCFDILPREIVVEIFKLLGPSELGAMAQTGKKFNVLATSDIFWKKIWLTASSYDETSSKANFRLRWINLTLKRRLAQCPPDRAPQLIARFRSATEIELTDGLVTSASLASVGFYLRVIRKLSLEISDGTQASHLKEWDVKKLIQKHPEIEHLTLFNLALSQNELESCIGLCANLRELHIVNKTLPNSLIFDLPLRQPGLRKLTLLGGKDLDDTTVQRLAKGCVLLEFLHLNGCHKVSYKSLATMNHSLKHLTNLKLDDVNEQGMKRWLKKNKSAFPEMAAFVTPKANAAEHA